MGEYRAPHGEQHALAANPTACKRVAQLFNPPLVAIIDDDAAIREALGDLLQVSGVEGVKFESAAELLEGDNPSRFDLVITDLRMPRVNGIELLHRLQASEPRPLTLVLTSCPDDEMRAKAMEAGATDYLTKPVAEDVLLARIEAILGSFRKSSSLRH